ncbi:hypothetical protein L249_5281 [Ophiocordyceps polyrhachis-furcata BCC 54312]|uniref:Golgi pH regulator conserved domain-containing protein n=1 Tax=Ophiocordyceps polyrhachis-furcata BCC 54312 TaxID=1330021 RepID=A0A367L8E0_9HYPO|nr:hypothetical protein L249_5281 [Ophiocordyceps polyrhachis-furcata BCC 54312]
MLPSAATACAPDGGGCGATTTATATALLALMALGFGLVVVLLTGVDHDGRWRRAMVAWTSGTTLALALALAVLVMADVAEVVDGAARDKALAVVVPALLLLLVVLVPWLECGNLASVLCSIRRLAFPLQLLLFGGWLMVFFSVGWAVPLFPTSAVTTKTTTTTTTTRTMTTALILGCLERVGVVGISSMAFLAGFAAVSAPWHTIWRRRRRRVTDEDVARSQAGLDAAVDMLASKRLQLSGLQHRDDEQALVAADLLRTGSGGNKAAEVRALRVDIAGLEAVEARLKSRLESMRDLRAAGTARGRVLALPSYVFSVYCVYRIAATALATVRRIVLSSPTPPPPLPPPPPPTDSSYPSSGDDPISRLLAQATPTLLDQASWTRTLSFLSSGLILAAGARSAIATFTCGHASEPPENRSQHKQAKLDA